MEWKKERKPKISDGYIVAVNEKILEKSKMLKTLIEEYHDEEIPLNKVNKNTFTNIIQYLKHYNTMEPKKISAPFLEFF